MSPERIEFLKHITKATAMPRLLNALLLVGTVLTAHESVEASVQIWNLSDTYIFYSRGFYKNGLWWSDGWETISPKESVQVSANDYLRIEGVAPDSLHPSGATDSSKCWRDPDDNFTVQESSDGSEVYLRGVRVKTTALKKKGFEYVRFSRYPDGKILKIGTYWSVGSKTLNFSHTTSGYKSDDFSHLNNKILDYSYSVTCARKDKGGVAWSLSNDRRTVHREGPILEASTFLSSERPCYKGTVTLYYAYR